jgi:heme/copper-type cytochrome/quinol oxidase subunit 4
MSDNSFTGREPAGMDDVRATEGRTITRRSIVVWGVMLVIVALEVAVTYARPAMPLLIATLLVLAAAQAFLALVELMHLRHERAILGWSMVGALLFVLAMMNQIWPDALRVFRLRQPH